MRCLSALELPRDINAPNTFGQITSTVSTARTVELALKFFF